MSSIPDVSGLTMREHLALIALCGEAFDPASPPDGPFTPETAIAPAMTHEMGWRTPEEAANELRALELVTIDGYHPLTVLLTDLGRGRCLATARMRALPLPALPAWREGGDAA